jgi:hypothetical protein
MACGGKYCTMADFDGVGFMSLLESVVTAVPVFFPVTLFMIFLFGSGASYFVILKTTGKKRFWQCITGMSFTTFVASLTISAMNTATTEYLSGYWVGFYIMMVVGSWFMLVNYK